MMRALVCLMLLVAGLATANSFGQCRLDYSNYELVWGDEFDYPTDAVSQLQAKWFPHYVWQSPTNNIINENDCDRYFWDPETNLSLWRDAGGNGYLNIGARKLPVPQTINGVSYKYSSSIIQSRYDDDCAGGYEPIGFQYGIFEIRCKVSPTQSGLSAFWLAGKGYEIDVFETWRDWNRSRKFFSSTHGTAANGKTVCSTFYDWLFADPADEFHTYTVAWTTERLTFFVDGHEYRTDLARDHSYPNDPGNCISEKLGIIASVHPHCYDANNPKTDGRMDPMVIDYIRVYRPKNYPRPVPAAYQFPPFKTTTGFSTYNVNSLAGMTADLSPLFSGIAACQVSSGEHMYFTTAGGEIRGVENSPHSVMNWADRGVVAKNAARGTDLAIDSVDKVLFYKGVDNDLWCVRLDGSAETSAALDAAKRYANDVAPNTRLAIAPGLNPRVYYKSIGNKLSYYERVQGAPAFWNKHTTAVDVTGELAANPSGTGVYFKAPDGEVWAYYIDNGAARVMSLDERNEYPNDVYQDVAAAGNRVFYLDNANTICYFEWSEPLQKWTKHRSTVSNAKRSLVATAPDTCYYISTDNDVYMAQLGSGGMTTGKLNVLRSDKSVLGGLMAGPGRDRRLYYIDNNNDLRFYEWGGCEVTEFTCGPNGGTGFGLGGSPSRTYASDKNSGIAIFPNPATYKLMVTSQYSYISGVVLYSMDGREVFRGMYPGTNKVVLDGLNLPAGSYYVKVLHDAGQVVEKIIFL